MVRLSFEELRDTLQQALIGLGLSADRAALSARLIAETDLDGVTTHGIARFPRFAAMVASGAIDPAAQPTLTTSFGALERWNGNLGPGNLAAHSVMARAMTLAETHGLGGVALANTTHWQRGGTYGWQAANAGFGAICWTNTLPNLPPWGASTPAVGNNPLVIAVPHAAGDESQHIVLDMAMSQYSYGTLATYSSGNQPLPFPGGYDSAGHLTTDAAEIGRSQRPLPVGYWKGSGLAFALDILGAILADGSATHQISPDPEQETGLTQVFLAVSPAALASQDALRRTAADGIAFLHAALPAAPGGKALYPGERTLRVRAENLRLGIPVNPELLKKIQNLRDPVRLNRKQ